MMVAACEGGISSGGTMAAPGTYDFIVNDIGQLATALGV